MSQIIAKDQYNKLSAVKQAYDAKDTGAFSAAKAELLNSFALLDDVNSISSATLLGEWIGKAEDFSDRYDDYSKDVLRINAKAIITTWKNSVSTGLVNYRIHRSRTQAQMPLIKVLP